MPLLDSLERLLNVESVLKQVEVHRPPSTGDMLTDYCDGSLFKSHPIFSTDPKALQIIAYYDELEICNPLGTRTKKHKLGVVLFSLGNISPLYRSKLTAMNLVTVATAPIIEKHGLDAILQPFLEDLTKLSCGYDFLINGTKRNFKGGLLCFLADNLASNALGGFKESFSFSFRFCRTCMVPTKDFDKHFNSKYFDLRCDSTHNNHCNDLCGPSRKHFSKTYGINRHSSLMDIPNYSMFNGGLPHDIMHDVFEGVAQYEIKLLLQNYIGRSLFTLDEYNRRLLHFDYGFSESDKPSVLNSRSLQSEDKKMHLSASQTILLCRILPFLIGDKVPEDDELWHCFLLLLKIIDLVVSPHISIDNCGLLKVLIEEHHFVFKSVYPNSSIIPKMHFMTHYPEQILSLGPMVCSWTMRQEAKLSFFKRASHLGNFKNIACTLARRHQRWMAYQSASGIFLNSPCECGPGPVPHELSDESEAFQTMLKTILPFIDNASLIFRPSWVKKNGITYRSNNAYLIIGSLDTQPKFGLILNVLIVSSDIIIFHVQCYNLLCYDDHFHSFVITPSPNQQLVPLSDLLSPFVIHSHILFDGSNTTYVRPKHWEFH